MTMSDIIGYFLRGLVILLYFATFVIGCYLLNFSCNPEFTGKVKRYRPLGISLIVFFILSNVVFISEVGQGLPDHKISLIDLLMTLPILGFLIFLFSYILIDFFKEGVLSSKRQPELWRILGYSFFLMLLCFFCVLFIKSLGLFLHRTIFPFPYS